jgi:peptidoglycan/xylan/chitin deacetylase (PgdA/CDA1 family)
MSSRPLASLSLDLDNVWSYMKTHGDPGWQELPTYLDTLADVALPRLAKHGLKITFFIVGQDAALDKNAGALKKIANAGHSLGNHSFSHEPWFHIYPPEKVEEEIARAETEIERVTGQRPRGYRGPGFSLTPETLRVLLKRGYLFDASTFPTFLGPIARAYYFFKSKNLSKEERDQRDELFGSAKEGLRQIHPYLWQIPGGVGDGRLLEIPVTTMPLARVPIHMSYLLYLGMRSRALALAYLKTAVSLCKVRGVGPSFLLHPLDFLGGDVEKRVDFFPGMNLSTETKLSLFDSVVEELGKHFELADMYTHAEAILGDGRLSIKEAA